MFWKNVWSYNCHIWKNVWEVTICCRSNGEDLVLYFRFSHSAEMISVADLFSKYYLHSYKDMRNTYWWIEKYPMGVNSKYLMALNWELYDFNFYCKDRNSTFFLIPYTQALWQNLDSIKNSRLLYKTWFFFCHIIKWVHPPIILPKKITHFSM